MRNSELAISIKALTKFYEDFQALNKISFEVKRGDFFAFLGPNGAGKTTTINILTGLSNYQSGQAKVFGYDVTSEYLHSRRLTGLCAQESNFDPFLTIYQLLVYQAEYFGIIPWEAKHRANELLERFGLAEKRNCKHWALSGGMKKRLLLCRALIHDPEILILDEPTSGCDLELKFLIWDYLLQLNKEGKTIGIINNGTIVRIGDKKQLLQDKSLQDVFLEITGIE